MGRREKGVCEGVDCTGEGKILRLDQNRRLKVLQILLELVHRVA